MPGRLPNLSKLGPAELQAVYQDAKRRLAPHLKQRIAALEAEMRELEGLHQEITGKDIPVEVGTARRGAVISPKPLPPAAVTPSVTADARGVTDSATASPHSLGERLSRNTETRRTDLKPGPGGDSRRNGSLLTRHQGASGTTF